MGKIDLINNLIFAIQNNELTKCIFTDELINKENDLKINLYVLINYEHKEQMFKYINDYLKNQNSIIHDQHYHNKSVYFYDNQINININYLFDFEYFSYLSIVSIYDPYGLIENFKVKSLPLTNKEFANNIDLISTNLFEFYNTYKQNDKILSYSYALKIQDVFILLYRGFYDSLNAKKKYQELQESMPFNYYNNLLSIIKIFKYELYLDAVQVVINEIDTIINNLPINIITLFNLDFYTFVKKLVYSL